MTVLAWVCGILVIAALAVALWAALLVWGPEPRGHDPEEHESPPVHKGDFR